MLIYTEHDIDFDISKTKVDVNKSPYYQDFLNKQYDWLFGELKTKSVIWCHPNTYNSVWEKQHGVNVQRWVLDVPEDKVLAYINRDAWDMCIHDMSIIPDAEQERWRKEFMKLIKGKPKKEMWAIDKEFYERKEKEWIEKHGPKEEQWKNKIFRKKINSAPRIEVLIPSPIDPKWIVDKFWYSRYDTKFHEDCHVTGFDSTDKAIEYLEIVKSFLNGRKLPYKLQCEGFRDGRVVVSVKKLWEPDED